MKGLALSVCILAVVLLSAPQDSGAQQLGQKVYWMAIIQVPLGELSQYHAFAEKELVPLQEKYGYRFVGTWQTIVGEVEEVVVIAEFESMAAYHQARVSLVTSEEWKVVGPRMSALTRGIRTRFMSATPYSTTK